MLDEGSFDAFDDVAPPPPALSLPPPPPLQPISPPQTASSGFGHLGHEAIASVSFHGVEDEARQRLEEVLRGCIVARGGAAADCSSAAAGSVHYFQSFVADYAGASDAAAAYTLPRPRYERLLSEPLPLPAARATAARGRGRGRGAGGRGRGGGGFAAFNGRYYDDDRPVAKPGELSAELRALLGMREAADPPPYLARMQQLGFPPGWLGDRRAAAAAAEQEDEPLRLYADADERGGATTCANGASSSDTAPPSAEPTVDIPGLNAPPPAGASWAAWGWPRPDPREQQRHRQPHPPPRSGPPPVAAPAQHAWDPPPSHPPPHAPPAPAQPSPAPRAPLHPPPHYPHSYHPHSYHAAQPAPPPSDAATSSAFSPPLPYHPYPYPYPPPALPYSSPGYPSGYPYPPPPSTSR